MPDSIVPTCGQCVFFDRPRERGVEFPTIVGRCQLMPPENRGSWDEYRKVSAASWCGQFRWRCTSGCTVSQQLGYERGMGGRKTVCPHE